MTFQNFYISFDLSKARLFFLESYPNLICGIQVSVTSSQTQFQDNTQNKLLIEKQLQSVNQLCPSILSTSMSLMSHKMEESLKFMAHMFLKQ